MIVYKRVKIVVTVLKSPMYGTIIPRSLALVEYKTHDDEGNFE